MFRILKSDWLAPKVRRLEVEAPRVALRHRPGHFVIVRAYAGGERIPLTIADSDKKRGTISLVIQVIGATTERLCSLGEGDALTDVVGPLGKATEIENFGHVVLVGGGVGTAVIYPQAAALKAKGNRVTAIMGGRSKPYVILEEELKAICDAVYPCTDDGSYVGLAPDISFSEERSAWGTTPAPEAPSNVHAIESATPPTSEDPPLSWNWICPIEIGNHVTDRSLEQGALHAEAARVRDGRTAGRARVPTVRRPKAGHSDRPRTVCGRPRQANHPRPWSTPGHAWRC